MHQPRPPAPPNGKSVNNGVQDNGLSLDPSAFTRDIRFQVPSFLSNHVGGAPTFPPGGEAWTGFSGANIFDVNSQLTPGALFSHVFGNQHNGFGGADNHVLDGLGGFMQSDSGWENWKENNLMGVPGSNVASSSTAPYAPPPDSNLNSTTAPAFIGPDLADGPGLYSTTGFDMVGVLARVAGRKDPKTVLGPVDLSCSFLVVDVRRFDCPIVYASPTFSALTGYELPQILGRNCRFLQAPDGDVVKGSKRKYTDNIAVSHLKRMLNAGKECQASLINYRRGGVPFINLVTVVPIPWDGTDIVYHVGFQVDLVEQPNVILRNMRDGSYQVNYTVSNPPQPPLRPPGRGDLSGLTPEMLDILGPRLNTLSEDGRMEWYKMVLENADDFVHVLSLKGLFQYVSPSVRRVLEYEPEDLLNRNIADLCHPSDIVPLMRELKDSTQSTGENQPARTVSLVFRIRRKRSGYVWIECTGRLHVEPGKGRKAVILSGRAIGIPTLMWGCVAKQGGLSANEFWAKLSYNGLILHVTESASAFLSQTMEDIVGQSFLSYLPSDDLSFPASPHGSMRNSMELALRAAANGETRDGAVTLTHTLIQPTTGALLNVDTIIYALQRTGSPLSSPDSDNSPFDLVPSPTSSSSVLPGGRPCSLLVQVKVVGSTSRPIVHPGNANMFEELETTRGTSWQYELHQLRLLNRRLKEDIANARSKGGQRAKGKKRKVDDGAGNGGLGGMGPPPVPGQTIAETTTAAPRHQLAAGFGFVMPGMPAYF
ncbi:hypothetical protein TREMEDRAFT_73480 [Tremella mesenterica DSM 1558]|uniref:uncharacterized protein n=1 Tax=Tremella mesenterica (strain ATCC 24925 / CBS 8224 / DSM 1558 / NBRC 9311 / NRRL Y-6157 / RJB 2259-6 / UBC 559-6) TaxID=578456 RepID=UPI0003F49143|nr:uncharacterized protein TREMEDRAFT_73480 [Tremella mesenterica DSM 1558]EIW70466.1 hypothetical protein TREMEDRAFT_73480 [Tremella mesenterica DSM 1558]